MKKVGIITFHRAKNYGAMLQAYALQEYLDENFETYILDYRCGCIEKTYYKRKEGFSQKMIKQWVCRPMDRIRLIHKDAMFFLFRKKYYHLSKRYDSTNIACANDYFDLFVSGSDQIWNLKWSEHDWNYFLEFAENDKKISYAASISSEVSKEDRERIRQNLNSYKLVSVRERKSVSFLAKLGIDKSIKCYCDPVFLLTKEEWINNFRLKKNHKQYILLYFVAKQNHAIEWAREIAKKENLDIIYLNQIPIPYLPEDVVNITGAGPVEFLEYIMNARYVFTTSFHGLAFSAIFNTPFYFELCDDSGNVNSRLENIRDILEIQDREIKGRTMPENKQVDWEKVNNKIKQYRNESSKDFFESIRNIC